MAVIGWMLDVAREQSPSDERLRNLFASAHESGFDAIGLYLEHRFAYPSAPWAAAGDALTPQRVRGLAGFARGKLRIVPFLNTLGHVEGFIRSSGGEFLREGPDEGQLSLQLCPSRPECREFARGLVEDALNAFDDEWVHLGGDETRQLGACSRCAEHVAERGKGELLADFLAPLCRLVLERGRRPCVWGDMLLAHPDALEHLPRQTLVFDWQYFNRPLESTQRLRGAGFDVVCCPSVQSYNSGWCFLPQTQQNIDQHAEDAKAAGATGVFVTTWEFAYFSQLVSVVPIVLAAGRRLKRGEPWDVAMERAGGAGFAEAARLLGERVPAACEFLRCGTWRTLRDRLVIRQNPFFLWEDWRGEACGPAGDEILSLCDAAEKCVAADHPLRFACQLHRVAVRWVRWIEEASRAYRAGRFDPAREAVCRGVAELESLRPGLAAAAAGGGSRADVRRLDILVDKGRRAAGRIGDIARRGEPCRPSFRTLVQDGWVEGDQAAWSTSSR